MAGGTATGADTARFVDQLKAAHKKRTDELERLVAQLQQDKQRKDREIEALTRETKPLRAEEAARRNTKDDKLHANANEESKVYNLSILIDKISYHI